MLDVSVLGRLGERLRLEAKSARGGLPKSMWETYSAFANTEGGTIVLGVEEAPDGSLDPVGVERPERLVSDIWNAVTNPARVSANILTSGDVRVERAVSAAGDEVSVVVVEVPRADRLLRPVFVGGNPLTGTYRRNGEGDYRCKPDEYQAMVRDASAAPLDAAPLPGFTVGALCSETVAAYRGALASRRPGHPWLPLSDEELLVRLGALRRENGEGPLLCTRAGLLMFGYEHEIVREFPSYFLDYRERYEEEGGRWSDRVTSGDGEWSGNVFDFWRRVSGRIVSELKRPFSTDGSQLRVDDTPMHRALREALVNSLIHADYYGSRTVVAMKFRDRVELSNPGDMRVPAEVALRGGVSDARNPTLMKMFSLIEACERAGSGLDAIRAACEAAGAPEIELVEGREPPRTHLTVFLGAAASLAPSGGAPSPAPPTDEERVLAFLARVGQASRSEVQGELGYGSTKTKRLLSSMAEAGLLAVRGAGNRVTYVLA